MRVCFRIGGKLWDSTWVLVEYLREQAGSPHCLLAGRKVLELGAGTGVLGMAVGRFVVGRPLSTRITDLPEVIPLLDLNLQLNGFRPGGPVTAEALAWGAEPAGHVAPVGPLTIIMSDVVYEPTLFPLLIATLQQHLPPTSSGGAAVMGYRRRNPDEWKVRRPTAQQLAESAR